MPGSEAGYYYSDIRKLVKKVDFRFSDGAEGSFFVITSVSSLLSRKMLLRMALAFILVLVFTSFLLTQWFRKGIFTPINQLNTAMQNIAEGNLEYMLTTEEKGEIGELYRNYEDMRLRLKESLDEKFEHEKKNRELISNISHDLKTPITAVKGYVEGIMDGVADTPEKMDKYIKTIYNKANDMDRLINELTTYSGIDNNRIPYNFHRINVAEYFGDCVEEVGLDLESKNIQLNYEDLVEPSTQIIADPEQLKRVINNIIGNSVKYLDKEQGIIDIRILDEVDSIRVEIEDNGKGIAAKDLPNIFERFYRTDASRNSSQGGSGIGLSIVKKIVEDHGGYIWATSKENEGTCMHFVIRKWLSESEKAEGKDREVSKILIVEDEEAIADLEKDYLELSDFEVTIENTGDKGLEAALSGNYDLVILDLMLPGVDGFEVCKQIREEKDIPIIMVSAKKDDIDKIRGLGLGADDYMTKPFSPSELVARVKAHMARYDRLVGSNQKVNDIIEIRGLKIDKTARRVYVDGEERVFTTKEFDLLTFLAENPNHVYSKEELFREIWDMDSIGDIATVTVHIKKIREKIEFDTAKPQYIETIWGIGYRFKI